MNPHGRTRRCRAPRLAVVLLLVLQGACSTSPRLPAEGSASVVGVGGPVAHASLPQAGPGEAAGGVAVQECLRLFASQDAAVRAAARVDGQAARIEGFPQLRIDRFLAALAPASDAAQFGDWLARLAALDAEGRDVELGNAGLPLQRDARARCVQRLNAVVLTSPARREVLRQAARVADDYSLTARVLGLYPLTSVPFLAGVQALHARTRAALAAPQPATPAGVARRYAPPATTPLPAAQVRALLARGARDAFGVPALEPAEADALLATHAPALLVDTLTADDHLGAPRLAADGGVWVDDTQPVVYTHIDRTRFAGETLLQLVYVAWFPARSASAPLDPLAGPVDGLLWRVTLDRDGLPLVYDSIHPCGCYHVVLPAADAQGRPRLVARPDPPGGWREPMLIASSAPSSAAGLQLTLSAGSHYLQRVGLPPGAAPGADGAAGQPQAPGETRVYTLRPLDTLRSLPLPDGARRSLYGAQGIVAGTERLERWLFWPMGVANAGAMRQWGRQPIAFVGRRHFDDPHLLQRWLQRP